MGIYEDWQIHTKTSFRPIKLQESLSGPHTNRTPSNNYLYCIHTKKLNCLRSGVEFHMNDIFHEYKYLTPLLRQLNFRCEYGIIWILDAVFLHIDRDIMEFP